MSNSLIESVHNAKSVYGEVKIGKVVPYRLVIYKAGLFTLVTDEMLTNPDEKQKNFANNFLEVLKGEFKKRDIVLIESTGNEQGIMEIKIAYRPGVPMLSGGAAGVRLIIGDAEIKRVVVTSAAGISDESVIKNSSGRLAKEVAQSF